ncbi:SHSA8 protein, partial [Crypturellus undulatus]|nr:SHSA8 protein [Crypturellus undulatus]
MANRGARTRMERSYVFGICCLVLLDPGRVGTSEPSTRGPEPEGQVESNNASWGPTAEDVAVAPTEAMPGGDRCRGYYDVMGQWDPPFNCNLGIYQYCCGTCGYRFCCQFKPGRLDQSGCSNYDTPNWVNTGQPPARVDETPEDPTRDKTNMIVYIICGVVAIMVLVGIFTKLGLEKSQSPQAEMTMSRTLTDLLKQPGLGPSEQLDGHVGSLQVQVGEGLSRPTPRNGTDKLHLNNAMVTNPIGGPPMGLSLAHSSRLPLQAPNYAKYATPKAVESAPEEFYKRFAGADLPASSTLPFPTEALALPESCPLGPKAKGTKGGPPPPLASPAFKGGWEGGRRQGYTTGRPFSAEKLPELFGTAPPHYAQPQRHLSTNSKTEVTV